VPRDIPHPTPHRSRFAAFWHSFGHDLAVSAAACGVIALLLLGTAPPSFAQGFLDLIVPVYEEVAVEESLVDEEIKRVALSNTGDEPVAIARVTKTQAGARASQGSGARASGGTKSSESKSSGSGSVSGGGSASPSQSTSQSGGTATVRNGSAPSAPDSSSQTAHASAPSPPATAPTPTPTPAPAPDGGGEGDHCMDGHGNDGNNKGCQ
jgi:hypothetical protein